MHFRPEVHGDRCLRQTESSKENIDFSILNPESLPIYSTGTFRHSSFEAAGGDRSTLSIRIIVMCGWVVLTSLARLSRRPTTNVSDWVGRAQKSESNDIGRNSMLTTRPLFL